jgi:DNA-binding response OmpR family regulator
MKYRMLMIDDDERLTRATGNAITLDTDWEFHSASDSRTALEAIAKARPDVIILDCDFGSKAPTGFDVLAKLRDNAEFRSIPVLVLTGNMVANDSKIEGLDLGADDYILKPVRPDVLLARARAAVVRAQKAMRMQ